MNDDTIESFMFDNATYRIADKQGRRALLRVFYAEGRYEIEGERDAVISSRIHTIARRLLERKHNVNFAEHVRHYKD